MAQQILLKLIYFWMTVLTLLPVSYTLTKYLLALEGPFDVFLRIRLWSGITEYKTVDEDGDPIVTRRNTTNFFWSKVLSCHNCLAPYVGLLIGVAGSHFVNAVAGGMGDGSAPWIIGLAIWPFLTGLTIILFDYLEPLY